MKSTPEQPSAEIAHQRNCNAPLAATSPHILLMISRRHNYKMPRLTEWAMSNGQAPRPILTKRQIEILRLIAEGLLTKEIAAHLKVSPKSIEFHKTRLYSKIGVTSIAGAVRYAIREGYVKA